MNITLPIAILILGAIGAGLAIPMAMQYQVVPMQHKIMDQAMEHASSAGKMHGIHHGEQRSNNYEMCEHEEHRNRDHNGEARDHGYRREEMHECMERQRSRDHGEYENMENTWINGTVQIVDPDGYVVIYLDNANITVKIHGIWLTRGNETITYNELLNNIETGDGISVLGHYCEYMEYVKAMKIIVNGEEFTRICMCS